MRASFMREDAAEHVEPALPRAGEWWEQKACTTHLPTSLWWEKIEDAKLFGHAEDVVRIACGCLAPLNFGRGTEAK